MLSGRLTAIVAGVVVGLRFAPGVAAETSFHPALERQHTADRAAEASETIEQAVQAIHRIKGDPELRQALDRSKGVLVLPAVFKGAVVIGGMGGEGVLLTREGQQWSSPAFVNLNSVTLGAQAGLTEGSVIMFLMSDGAAERIRQDGSIHFGVGADLSVYRYSAGVHAGSVLEDVIVWSDFSGAFVGASVAALTLTADDAVNAAYYHRQVAVGDVLSGAVRNPNEKWLQEALRQ